MKIEIINISDSDKHFAEAIGEYVKRMGWGITLTDLKPVKHGTTAQIIESETQLIIDQLHKKDVATYLLSKEGKQLSTEEFGQLLPQHDHHLRFVIGGPFGLNESLLKPYVVGKLAFGQITMPHGLAKLVLVEQCYRIQQIIDGRQYHY